MSILSPILLFLLLPLVLIAFYQAGKARGENGALFVLLFASLIFAQTQGWWFFGLFFASLLINLWLVRLLISGRGGGWALLIGVAANLAALALFKYANVLNLLPGGTEWALMIGSLIPITISFLSFQRIAALADARANAEHLTGRKGALRFAAFASAFPNLLIGPIAYLQEILPQFRRSDFGRARSINFAVGLTLIAIGLFKKAYLGDGIGAAFVDPIWRAVGAGHMVSSLDGIGAVGGYMLQLYFDFSGYSDMAIGIARLFGIILPINFYSPFRATGIADFYRRWHITLTRIIARFLFTPLSIAGTRFAAQRRWRGIRMKLISLWIPLIANFAIIGVWHGAAKTFVLFGLIHGIWYVAEAEFHASKVWQRNAGKIPARLKPWIGRAIALPMLALTFSLFRAPNVDQLTLLLHYMSDINRQYWLTVQPGWQDYGLVLLGVVIVALLPNTQEFLRRYRPGIVTYPVNSHTPLKLQWRWQPRASWALAIAIVAALGIYALPRAAAFSYQMF